MEARLYFCIIFSNTLFISICGGFYKLLGAWSVLYVMFEEDAFYVGQYVRNCLHEKVSV